MLVLCLWDTTSLGSYCLHLYLRDTELRSIKLFPIQASIYFSTFVFEIWPAKIWDLTFDIKPMFVACLYVEIRHNFRRRQYNQSRYGVAFWQLAIQPIVLSTGPNVIKLFTSVIYECSQQARVVVLIRAFQSSLMFSDKTRILPKSGVPERCSTEKGSVQCPFFQKLD